MSLFPRHWQAASAPLQVPPVRPVHQVVLAQVVLLLVHQVKILTVCHLNN